MTHATPSEEEVASTLSHLKLSTKTPSKPANKPKSKPVADSWEDDLSGSDTETEDEPNGNANAMPIKTTNTNDIPNPPPPTPASPTPFDFPDNRYSSTEADSPGVSRSGSGRATDRRPDKTTATANRLIAGALGVRAPKRTEEEREYDKAMREKERKRRDEERAKEKREKEETEERKRAVWED